VAPLAHTRAGTGPPLVLLHPLGADRRVWMPVVELLTDRREVIAPDLPGFGASPALDGAAPPSPARLADAVWETVRALGVDRPHVAGNSLGGWVALELAAAGRARSVTAIAPAGLWPHPLGPRRGSARHVARAVRPLLPALLSSPRLRRLALAGTMAHPERVPRRDAVHLVRAYASAGGFDAANAAMRSGRFTRLADVPPPVTLAWPEHDRLVGRPRRLPPHIRSIVLTGCGHIPTWDDPSQVARVLLDGSGG